MKEVIHHLRGRNANGGITTVATYNRQLGTTTIRYSVCSIKDNYCKRVGYYTAISNMAQITTNGNVTKATPTLMVLVKELGPYSSGIKSLVHSLLGKKTTNKFMENLYTSSSNSLVHTLVKASDLKNNQVTYKSIELLLTLQSIGRSLVDPWNMAMEEINK